MNTNCLGGDSKLIIFVIVLSVMSGCASAPKLDQIPNGETVSIVVDVSPNVDGQLNLEHDSVTGSAAGDAGVAVVGGAGVGAAGGAAFGALCGFMAPVCIPIFATTGAVAGGTAGVVGSAGYTLPTEQATQFRDRMRRLNESQDKLAELTTNINDRAGRYWDLNSTEPKTTVRVGVQNLVFLSTWDYQVRAILQISVTIEKKSDKPLKAEEAPVVKYYEAASPYGSLDLWLDDESNFASASISSAIRQVSSEIVYDLAISPNIDESVLLAKVNPGSSSNGTPSAVEFYGEAEAEIDNNTYDQSLWDKALVETGRDQTKSRARYIELRANQLYSEKVGSVSGTSLYQQATPITQDGQIDLSGSYFSDITSNQLYVFRRTKYRKTTITLMQNGSEVTGTDPTNTLKIRGTIEGDTINFYMLANNANGFRELKGIWKIRIDGTGLDGEWEIGGAKGTWNLTKFEGVKAISSSTANEIDTGKGYATIAAEEIDTKTYDKNLWDKALVETGGDQNKTKARYIELRANQLYSEKVGPVSDASLDQRAASVTPDTSIDISGTYRSDIIGSGDWSLGRFPNIEVILKQNKGEISGTFSGTRSGEIEGILNGDTIKFKWFLTVGRTESGRGEWKLTNDGITWNGTWRSTRGSRGNWNLTKIE